MATYYGADTSWPPIPLAVSSALREWDAWYTGDPAKLDVHYGADDMRPRVRRSQMAGGLVGATSRFFWGQPSAVEGARQKLHMPIAQDIATASADLLFGEEVTLEWEDTRAQERMAYVLDGNNFHARMVEAAELAAALGGCYLRVAWDASLADHALVTVVPADGVVPTFRYGRLTEATVWQVVRHDGGSVWRHLEIHEPGLIRHELRLGTADRLGRPASLDSLSETAGLPEQVATGYDRLAISYVPNVMPAPLWRTDPMGRNLGRSDFGIRGVPSFMDALDETWTSWMRDLRLGKARIMVAGSMLDSTAPGAGASFDLDREVYEAVRFMQPQDASLSQMVSAQQFAIRTAEHAQTVDALLGVVVRSCGYSGSTFGLVEDVTKTATEVHSVDRRTATTRERKTRYWGSALQEFLLALSAIDAAQFRRGTPSPVRVVFPPASQPALLDTATAVQAFRSAQAMSIETAVQLAQPDLDESGLAAEVARIMEETAAAAPQPTVVDPFGLGGTDDGTDAPGVGTEPSAE